MRRTLMALAVGSLVGGLVACGDEAVIGPTAPGDGSTEAARELPEADFAWALDGNGAAEVGNVDLEFSGSHSLTDESVAFDGVTGSATSAGSALIDTTKSFSVAAWVSLDHAEEYAVAVSQIGEVAAAFYLGRIGNTWSFNMKRADGPGGNAYARQAAGAPDPAAWVHLVGVYDDDTHQIRLYVDGEFVADSDVRAEWQAQGILTIGRTRADGAPAAFWPGAIAEVRTYAVVLTDDEVAALARAGPGQPPPALPPVPEGFHCPTGGGRCLGPLGAGAYTTEIFQPPITYAVPDGWTNEEDMLGNFSVTADDGSGSVGIYRNIGVPLECVEEPDPTVGPSVDELVDWYTSHPGIAAGEPQPVTVGGLHGSALDVTLAPSWRKGCAWSGGRPTVGIIIGAGPSSLTHVLLPDAEERLCLLDVAGGNIVIEITPTTMPLAEFVELIAPIIDSIEFG